MKQQKTKDGVVIREKMKVFFLIRDCLESGTIIKARPVRAIKHYNHSGGIITYTVFVEGDSDAPQGYGLNPGRLYASRFEAMKDQLKALEQETLFWVDKLYNATERTRKVRAQIEKAEKQTVS